MEKTEHPDSWILMIDDDDEAVRLVSAFLPKSGFALVPCPSLSDALAWIAKRGIPRLIVCDQNLPGDELPGTEIIRVIRADAPETTWVPTVLCSAGAVQIPAGEPNLHVSPKPVTRTSVARWLELLSPPKSGSSLPKTPPEEFFRKLMMDYATRLPSKLALMELLARQALADAASVDRLLDEAHRLGGTGASYGLLWLHPLGATLEKLLLRSKVEAPGRALDPILGDAILRLAGGLASRRFEELISVDLEREGAFRELRDLLSRGDAPGPRREESLPMRPL